MDIPAWLPSTESLIEMLKPSRIGIVLVTALVAVVALGALRLVVLKVAKPHLKVATYHLLRKFLSYAIFTIVTLLILDAWGINLTGLLGAAGVVGIAVGFASQTVVSNMISGLFLVSEKPFEPGDVVTVDGVTGVVMAVDMMSVKLRTFDNTLVRMPNETLFKSRLVNVSRFPIRRMDMEISVAYGTDLRKALDIVRRVIADNRWALANPEPFIMIKSLGDSGIPISLGVWFEKADYVDLRNSILTELVEAFGAEGVEIPFPQVVVHTESEAT